MFTEMKVRQTLSTEPCPVTIIYAEFHCYQLMSLFMPFGREFISSTVKTDLPARHHTSLACSKAF
jgi:hypothetical protein